MHKAAMGLVHCCFLCMIPYARMGQCFRVVAGVGTTQDSEAQYSSCKGSSSVLQKVISRLTKGHLSRAKRLSPACQKAISSFLPCRNREYTV